MKRHSNQNGFGTLQMALVAVAVVVVGFAGWFVWSNQQETNKAYDDSVKSAAVTKKKTTAKTSTKPAPAGSLVVVKVDGDRATVQAPKDWVVSAGSPYDTPDLPKATTIASPTGEVFVRFERLGGLGGVCLPEETAARVSKVIHTPMTADTTVSFAEYYVKNAGTYLSYHADMIRSSYVAKMTEGANICDAYISEVTPSLKGFDGGAKFGIHSKQFDDQYAAGKAATEADYDKFVASSDYKTAKSIILSLKY